MNDTFVSPPAVRSPRDLFLADAACGVPGPVQYWDSSIDDWARKRIATFDAGRLDRVRQTICRDVVPDFFGLLGRVTFGAATELEVDQLLVRAERAGALSPDTVLAARRVALAQCGGAQDCRCAEFRRRAQLVLERPTKETIT